MNLELKLVSIRILAMGLLTLTKCRAQILLESFQIWTQEWSLPTGMEVKWNSDDLFYLTFEMSAPTLGYVAVGFSPNGGMKGSDIVVGWVDSDGMPYLVDFHTPEREQPIQDDQQDYDLIAASERDGRTTVRFRRRWDTCDQQDLKITDDTARLIWAWHPSDPRTIPVMSFNWHGMISRGSRTILLKSQPNLFKFPDQMLEGQVNDLDEHWDVTMSRVHIEHKESTYMCRIFKFPRADKKFHLTGFRPLILKAENIDFVHHITLYTCSVPVHYGGTRLIFEKYVGTESSECFAPQTPDDWTTYCLTFLLTWAPGFDGEMFPANVGILIAESPDDTTYFKLEVHYSNPLRKSFMDNSGLRLFYSETLREHEVGTLVLGHRITPFQMIPPFQEQFTTQSFCSKECTRNGFSSSGARMINVTSGLLHAHASGRKIILRHIRDGNELPPILQDNNFDVSFQQFRKVNREVTVFSGDELIVECTYDTERRSTLTFGGLSPEEEMCQATVLYYPRTDLTDCRSQPEFDSFFGTLGILNVTGTIFNKLSLPWTKFRPYITLGSIDLVPVDNTLQLIGTMEQTLGNPFEMARMTTHHTTSSKNFSSVGTFFRQINWHDEEMIRRIETSWRDGLHYMFCSTSDLRRIPIEEPTLHFPKFKPYPTLSRQSDCRDARSHRSSAPRLEHVTLTLLIELLFHFFRP